MYLRLNVKCGFDVDQNIKKGSRENSDSYREKWQSNDSIIFRTQLYLPMSLSIAVPILPSPVVTTSLRASYPRVVDVAAVVLKRFWTLQEFVIWFARINCGALHVSLDDICALHSHTSLQDGDDNFGALCRNTFDEYKGCGKADCRHNRRSKV